MGNVVTSPNDPLFWLHHGYVDYVGTNLGSLFMTLARLIRTISCRFGGSGRVTTRLVLMTSMGSGMRHRESQILVMLYVSPFGRVEKLLNKVLPGNQRRHCVVFL